MKNYVTIKSYFIVLLLVASFSIVGCKKNEEVISLSDLKPGHHKAIYFNDVPILIIYRNVEMINNVTQASLSGSLIDPKSSRSSQPKKYTNEYRSIEKKWFIVEAYCNNKNNTIAFLPRVPKIIVDNRRKPPGFRCNETNTNYDMAGRVYKGGKETNNLNVPNYDIKGDRLILFSDN